MKLYIDVSVLTLATFITGIQRVTREIAVRIVKEKKIETVLLHYNAADHCYYKIDNRRFWAYYVKNAGIKEKMVTKQRVNLAEIGAGAVFFDLDAAWMCRMKRSYLLPILKKQGAKIIAHIYDIISITHPQYCLERGVYNFMDYIAAHMQYADQIIVNAQATVNELQWLADQIGTTLPECHVVPLGADFKENKAVLPEEAKQEVVSAAKQAPYILMVGTIEPRKNHKLLLEAYDSGLKEMGYQILFAGYMGWNMEDFEAALKAHPDFGKGIYHFEGLGDKEIAYLYQHAKFLAFCSYTEGFGLPIIEAILKGTPVLASDIPVSREVAGDACVYFEQDNVEELCQKVAFYHQNEKAYEDMRDKMKGYRFGGWKESYQKMMQVIKGVCE